HPPAEDLRALGGPRARRAEDATPAPGPPPRPDGPATHAEKPRHPLPRSKPTDLHARHREP
ncbi:MAG TPA: hypothetical protein VK013_03220, partial [Myxococcaceae bacterium]|nr:hypothetical protein [Myxococcaceae bacterium]